jgi:hypothetical protein
MTLRNSRSSSDIHHPLTLDKYINLKLTIFLLPLIISSLCKLPMQFIVKHPLFFKTVQVKNGYVPALLVGKKLYRTDCVVHQLDSLQN